MEAKKMWVVLNNALEIKGYTYSDANAPQSKVSI